MPPNQSPNQQFGVLQTLREDRGATQVHQFYIWEQIIEYIRMNFNKIFRNSSYNTLLTCELQSECHTHSQEWPKKSSYFPSVSASPHQYNFCSTSFSDPHGQDQMLYLAPQSFRLFSVSPIVAHMVVGVHQPVAEGWRWQSRPNTGGHNHLFSLRASLNQVQLNGWAPWC